MEKVKTIITLTGVFMLLFYHGNMSGNMNNSAGSYSDQTTSKSAQTNQKTVQTQTKSTQANQKTVQTKTKSVQTVTKTTQTKPKTIQKSAKPGTDNKIKEVGIVKIGTQIWSETNLNVITFRNGDTIPEAKTNKEWVAAGEAGKPVWCYYNNNPAIGQKYGKLYNWYAVNDPRGLAPVGWTLSSDADWAKLTGYLGGTSSIGNKMKSTIGWNDGYNGTNEAGFAGLPGGYRVENGAFLNFGTIGTWWSTEESNPLSAVDHYLSQGNSLSRSSSPKQRGESVRCIRK